MIRHEWDGQAVCGKQTRLTQCQKPQRTLIMHRQ